MRWTCGGHSRAVRWAPTERSAASGVKLWAARGTSRASTPPMPNPREQLRATLAGNLAALEVGIAGLRGIFRRLAKEHHHVGELLGLATTERDPSRRRELWSALRDALRVHERTEERALYPLFRDDPALSVLVDVHHAEAAQLDGLLADLDALGGDSPDWESSMERLYFALRQHVTREEEFFFPRFQDALSAEQAQQLKRRYLQEKEAVRLELGHDAS